MNHNSVLIQVIDINDFDFQEVELNNSYTS